MHLHKSDTNGTPRFRFLDALGFTMAPSAPLPSTPMPSAPITAVPIPNIPAVATAAMKLAPFSALFNASSDDVFSESTVKRNGAKIFFCLFLYYSPHSFLFSLLTLHLHFLFQSCTSMSHTLTPSSPSPPLSRSRRYARRESHSHVGRMHGSRA